MSNSKSKKLQPLLPRLRIGPRKQVTPLKEKQYVGANAHILEQIIEKRRLQRQLIDHAVPFSSDEAQSSIHQEQINSLTREDFLKHYRSYPGKPTMLREKALRGIHPIDQKLQQLYELRKLDEKVNIINERNPLQESWKSPFLTQCSRSTASLRNYNEVDLSASQEIEANWQNQQLLNDNIRGFGSKLRTYLDYDKHTVHNQKKGNPKFFYRDQINLIIKHHTTDSLDLVKKWNDLVTQDRLLARVSLPIQEGRLQQFGTISSISHYYSIQDFHKKKPFKPINTQQQTPKSQVSPHFLVKNSRQSESQSAQEIRLEFGKTVKEQIVGEFEEEQQHNLEEKQDVSIHRDTFLTYCQVFWDLMRKEDEIVERVVWAFCKGDQFYFQGFKHFYKLLVQGLGTVDEYVRFTYDFFMAQDRNEVPFVELQGLLKLLLIHVDRQLKPDNYLSDQILLDIVNHIHRPQNIPKDVLWQLIYEDKIPATLVVRLVYENRA